jgi:hypothetical protein
MADHDAQETGLNNSMTHSLTLFWIMFRAALLSTTGTGNLPIVHQDLLARRWATDRQFAESLAIGQISPGPTGLWVISLGYLVGGLRGAGLTLVASRCRRCSSWCLSTVCTAAGATIPPLRDFSAGWVWRSLESLSSSSPAS